MAIADFSKEGSPRLSPRLSLPVALQRINGACLQRFSHNAEILLDARSPEAVHAARVALRQLRTALDNFKDMLPQAEFRIFRQRLRDMASLLGEVRDLDVILERMVPNTMHDRLLAERENAWEVLEAELRSGAAQRLSDELTHWLRQGRWRRDPAVRLQRNQALTPFAARLLDRQVRKLGKHGKHFRKLDDDGRHRLRKDAKRLRYSAEAFAALFPAKGGTRRKFLTALREFQNRLGDLNDRRIEREHMSAEASPDAPLAPQSWLGEQGDMIDAAARSWKRLKHAKPFWK